MDFMLRAQELFKTVDIINRKLVDLDFIASTTISAYIKLIAHQGTFQNPKMSDAPFRNILLLNVILECVEKVRLPWLPFLFLWLRMQEQVILSHDEILCQCVGWSLLT